MKGKSIMHKKYTIFSREKIVAALLIAVVIFLIGAVVGSYCFGEEPLATCYAFCKPGSTVIVRLDPSEGSGLAGRMDFGDEFKTDGESIDGWIRCIGIGEGGWVYSAYASTSKPEKVGAWYFNASVKQVAIRRWPTGPMVEKKPWLQPGETIQVLASDGEWAITTRGYVKADFIEPYWEE